MRPIIRVEVLPVILTWTATQDSNIGYILERAHFKSWNLLRVTCASFFLNACFSWGFEKDNRCFTISKKTFLKVIVHQSKIGHYKMIMQRITNYNDQDVLCGRGGGTLRHPGNKKVCALQLNSVQLMAFNYDICELTKPLSLRRTVSITH